VYRGGGAGRSAWGSGFTGLRPVAPGPFTLRQAAPGSGGAPYRRIEIRADRTFEPWPGRVAAFILQGLALEPGGGG